MDERGVAEPEGCDDGRCGSLGATLVWLLRARAFSKPRAMAFSVAGLASGDDETSSHDSVRLTASLSPPTSPGKVAMKLDSEPGVLMSVSDDSETEWNEEIDEPPLCFVGERGLLPVGDGG